MMLPYLNEENSFGIQINSLNGKRAKIYNICEKKKKGKKKSLRFLFWNGCSKNNSFTSQN